MTLVTMWYGWLDGQSDSQFFGWIEKANFVSYEASGMRGALLLLGYGTILSLVQMIFSLFKPIIIPSKTGDKIKLQHVFVNCV